MDWCIVTRSLAVTVNQRRRSQPRWGLIKFQDNAVYLRERFFGGWATSEQAFCDKNSAGFTFHQSPCDSGDTLCSLQPASLNSMPLVPITWREVITTNQAKREKKMLTHHSQTQLHKLTQVKRAISGRTHWIIASSGHLASFPLAQHVSTELPLFEKASKRMAGGGGGYERHRGSVREDSSVYSTLFRLLIIIKHKCLLVPSSQTWGNHTDSCICIQRKSDERIQTHTKPRLLLLLLQFLYFFPKSRSVTIFHEWDHLDMNKYIDNLLIFLWLLIIFL